MKILIKKLSSKAVIPTFATSGSSGMDLYSALDEDVVVNQGGRVLIPCGISIAIPEGYECQVRPRSGLALHCGLTVLNTPGTVDSDYRGELKVILVNLGEAPFVVESGMRIAQMVFQKVEQPILEEVDELPDTSRGNGGFGSSGRK